MILQQMQMVQAFEGRKIIFVRKIRSIFLCALSFVRRQVEFP